MYTIKKRKITLNDFLKLKKFSPFKVMRKNSKYINFGAIFNCSGPTLGRQLKAAGFSESDCDAAMETFKLENAFNAALLNSGGKTPLEIKYIIVGSKLRELFFQTYPCLLERTEREQRFAIKNGYVRTWGGPIRHMPELRYMQYNAQGNIIGADKKLYSKMFSHLKNNASNTAIQTAEVYQAMPDVTTVHNNLKNWKFKSRVWGYVHDSIALYVYKPEIRIIYALLNKVANINREPYYDLPMHIDVEESNLDNDEYYGNGREIFIEDYDLDTELAQWNKEHGTNLKFVSYIPL